MHILRNTPATLEVMVYQSGVLIDFDTDPTIAITDANGEAVAAGAVSNPSTGVYHAGLAAQANLAELTAVWSGEIDSEATSISQRYEIVGNLLFTEAQARAAQTTGGQTPLSSESAYPDAVIARARDLITEQFEDRTGRSWIRRYCRMELKGSGSPRLRLTGYARDVNGNVSGGRGSRRRVASLIHVTNGGVVVDLGDIVISGNELILTAGHWATASSSDPLNVVVEFEYGDDPVAAEANEHGLRTVLATLVQSDLSSWAETVNTLEGTERFPAGGLVWPPKVKEWLDQTPVLAVG